VREGGIKPALGPTGPEMNGRTTKTVKLRPVSAYLNDSTISRHSIGPVIFLDKEWSLIVILFLETYSTN
jgi:hypothetical protein